MLGTTDQMWGEFRGEYDYIDRSIAATATLGFHAPLLPLGDAPTIRTADAQRGYRVLTAAFSEILSLAYSPESQRGLIDSDLLLQAMRTPPTPEDFFYIDTVDKAGRWNIRVSDIEIPRVLNEEAAANACLNATAWPIALASLRYGERFEPQSVQRATRQGALEVLGPLAGYAGHGCTIEQQTEETPETYETEYAAGTLVRGCFNDDYQRLDYCGTASILSVFPPDTLLRELVGESGRRLAQRLTGPLFPTAAALSCAVGSDRARVTNVNEYVNIRTGATLRAPIVARAGLGEVLSLPEPGTWYFLETPRGRQCSSLCERLTRSGQDRSLESQVRTCIEGAEIWQRVRNARGQQGFVSVNFLAAE
jgi:hypothetical protein